MKSRAIVPILLILLAIGLMVGAASAATLYVYATEDGQTTNATDAAFTAQRDGIGAIVDRTSADAQTILAAAATENVYDYSARTDLIFNLSGLSANWTPGSTYIKSAKVYLRGTTKTNQLGSPTYSLTASTPSSFTELVATDYNKFSDTPLSNSVAYADLSTTGYTAWTLDTAGRAYLNISGYTPFKLRNSWDIANSFGGAWAASCTTLFKFRTSEYTGVASDPYIAIEYDTISCPIDLETMYNVTGDGTDESSEIQVAFTYASAHEPCEVVFPAGKTITVNQTLTTGNATEIDGSNSIIRVQTGYVGTDTTILTLGDYNYVHDLKFDQNRDGELDGHNVNGIEIGNWNVFEHNEVYNTSAYGLYSYRDSNWIVRYNSIHDGDQYGVSPTGSAILTYSENISIHSNTIWNMSEVGIKIKGTGNSSVYNNSIIIPDGATFSASGIRYYSADTSTKNVYVYDNTISGDYTNVTGAGNSIGIASDPEDNPGAVIERNVINSTDRGLFLQSNASIARNNTIGNSRKAGIELNSNDNGIYHNILTNAGIMVTGTPRTATNNTFRSNIVSGGNQYFRSDGDGAFLWYNTEGNIFDFNTLNVDRFGIHINSTYGLTTDTQITNNVITAGGACYLDLGNDTYFFNNTCNGALAAPVAAFTSDVTSGYAPTTVTFTDTSTGGAATSWAWNLTNATNSSVPMQFSTDQNPAVILGYGNYNITLTATNSGGSNTTMQPYWVNITLHAPVAAFSADHTSICSGDEVTFTDETTGSVPTSWLWSFGDGNTTNQTERNPIHEYTSDSQNFYTVSVYVENMFGNDTETKTNYITVQRCLNLTAEWEAQESLPAGIFATNFSLISLLVSIIIISAIISVILIIKYPNEFSVENPMALAMAILVGVILIVVLYYVMIIIGGYIAAV